MTIDRSCHERNQASTQRIRVFAALSDEQLQVRVGQHWTVGIMLAHLAFWDRRALDVLEKTQQAGKLTVPEVDVSVNDLSLPLWAAIPPREAGRLAVEAAEDLDARLESFPLDLLEAVSDYNRRWVDRSLHRNQHMDEAEEALHA
jgi:hypothetical protein